MEDASRDDDADDGENLMNSSTTCSHTHTFNPNATTYSHTSNHGQTRVRSLGNRVAVRKYREKKKARAAYLEEEVKKLRAVNQQLVRKLERQAMLQSEVVRLRGLLVDLRAKVGLELGSCSSQKQANKP